VDQHILRILILLDFHAFFPSGIDSANDRLPEGKLEAGGDKPRPYPLGGSAFCRGGLYARPA
jgi:hypothetical protein